MPRVRNSQFENRTLSYLPGPITVKFERIARVVIIPSQIRSNLTSHSPIVSIEDVSNDAEDGPFFTAAAPRARRCRDDAIRQPAEWERLKP